MENAPNHRCHRLLTHFTGLSLQLQWMPKSMSTLHTLCHSCQKWILLHEMMMLEDNNNNLILITEILRGFILD